MALTHHSESNPISRILSKGNLRDGHSSLDIGRPIPHASYPGTARAHAIVPLFGIAPSGV